MIIKSVEYGSYLEFTNPIYSEQSKHVEDFNIKIAGPAYSGIKQVYLYDGPYGLIDLFDKIAKNWKGWKGEIKWGSLENEFTISAIADKLGHIELKVQIQENTGGDFWIVNGRIMIESGQLDQIAKEIKAFFNT
jgi:hypothetical protein